MKSVESAKKPLRLRWKRRRKSRTGEATRGGVGGFLGQGVRGSANERKSRKKLAKAEAQAEAAETEREQKVLEAHQRQMEIEKVAKERQFKLEEEQRQMEAAKKRAMAKSTQYHTCGRCVGEAVRD